MLLESRALPSRALARGVDGDTALRIADDLSVHLAREVDALQARRANPMRYACAAGCAWCCHQPVTVHPFEALRIADYLRATFRGRAFDHMLARVREASRVVARARPGDDVRPCVFLDERRRCQVHSVRPSVCATYLSNDERACRALYEHRYRSIGTIVVDEEVIRLRHMADIGIARGLEDVSLDFTPLELTAAVTIALDTPDAAERWLRGDTPFGRASADGAWEFAEMLATMDDLPPLAAPRATIARRSGPKRR
jgi:Fe-S-cluster containining protein